MQAHSARTVRTSDGAYVVTAAPRAGIISARWSDALARARRHGATLVVLDLLDTNAIDEHGLALLVEVADQLRAAGGELCLVVTSPQLLNVLDLSGADRHFAVRPTVTAGLEAVAAGR